MDSGRRMPAGKGHHIMVVSGDPEFAGKMEAFLDDQSYIISLATSGEDALAICKGEVVHIVVLDYPHCREGLDDLVADITAVQPQIRFIVLNAPEATHRSIRSQHPRVIAMLPAPFNPEVLGYYLRAALNFRDSSQNRRGHHRYIFNVEIHCVTINPFDNSSSRPHAALMREISRSGASMIVRQMMPVPAILKLIVQLPNQTHPTQFLGKSVSCTMTQIPGVYRLGAKFMGLLPANLAQSISALNQQSDKHDGTDIFMGKSFKEALREWLVKHQGELGNDWPGFDLSITELADAMGSNDESEVIECEEHVLRAQAEAERQAMPVDG